MEVKGMVAGVEDSKVVAKPRGFAHRKNCLKVMI